MQARNSAKLPLNLATTLTVLLAVCACDTETDSLQQTQDQGQSLRVLVSGPAEALDPRAVFETQGLRMSRLLFASLVTIDPNSLQPVPQLAESIEVQGDVRYHVRLRPNLRFADGSPLDADDVIATFRSIGNEKLQSRYAATYQRIKQIEKLTSLDVVFTIDAPHAPFMTDLEFPILRSEDTQRLWIANDDAQTVFAVSSGPFVLKRWSRRLVDLGPNPHWQGRARVAPNVRFITIESDNTRAMRLLAGGGDLAPELPSSLLPLFTDHPELHVQSAPGINTTYLGLNTARPALRSAGTRHAIAASINKEKLIEARISGHGQAAASWIPPQHWAAAETSETQTRASLPAAELTLRTTSDHGRVATARAIAAMLEAHGARVRVRPSEKQTLLADLGQGRFDLALLSVPEVIEPHVLSWFFASSRIPSATQSGANRWRFASAALDSAFEEGTSRYDLKDRQRAYKRVQRILTEAMPVVPLWHEDVSLVARKSLGRLQVARHGRYDFLLQRN